MKFVTLTFDRDHTHAGRPIKRGEVRDIPQHNAEWLIGHAIAHPTPAAVRARLSTPQPTSETPVNEEMHHESE